MGNEFQLGHLLARSQYAGSDSSELDLRDYDVLVLGSSWDSRSVWLSKQVNIRSSIGVLITYLQEDPFGRQRRHNIILLDFLQLTCTKVYQICVDSHDIVKMWQQLAPRIVAAELQLNRPLRICVDLTAIPRFCSLAALGCLLANGRANQFTFVYAEGEYDDRRTKEETVTFHEGEWRAEPIPFFGTYDPLKKRHYIVSVGFEGRQTYRAVLDGEPNRVSILFPRPGVKRNYERRASEQNRKLIDDYCVPKTQIIYACAGDAVAAWKNLHLASLERTFTENVFFLCCGTKPHALGLALHAISLHDPIILYYVADSHTVTDVQLAGKFWRYDITDTSSIVPSTAF
jgi:hypothetical protein